MTAEKKICLVREKKESLKVLQRYFQNPDAAAMSYLYDETTRRLAKDLWADPESIRFHFEMAALDDPRARSFTAKDFWDSRLVEEIRKSGFVDQLYRKEPSRKERKRRKNAAATSGIAHFGHRTLRDGSHRMIRIVAALALLLASNLVLRRARAAEAQRLAPELSIPPASSIRALSGSWKGAASSMACGRNEDGRARASCSRAPRRELIPRR